MLETFLLCIREKQQFTKHQGLQPSITQTQSSLLIFIVNCTVITSPIDSKTTAQSNSALAFKCLFFFHHETDKRSKLSCRVLHPNEPNHVRIATPYCQHNSPSIPNNQLKKPQPH